MQKVNKSAFIREIVGTYPDAPIKQVIKLANKKLRADVPRADRQGVEVTYLDVTSFLVREKRRQAKLETAASNGTPPILHEIQARLEENNQVWDKVTHPSPPLTVDGATLEQLEMAVTLLRATDDDSNRAYEILRLAHKIRKAQPWKCLPSEATADTPETTTVSTASSSPPAHSPSGSVTGRWWPSSSTGTSG